MKSDFKVKVANILFIKCFEHIVRYSLYWVVWPPPILKNDIRLTSSPYQHSFPTTTTPPMQPHRIYAKYNKNSSWLVKRKNLEFLKRPKLLGKAHANYWKNNALACCPYLACFYNLHKEFVWNSNNSTKFGQI